MRFREEHMTDHAITATKRSKRRTRGWRRLAAATDGVAAIEFALIAPIMITLFMGILEGADALAASRRATVAANGVADLVAQAASPSQADLNDLFDGMTEVLELDSGITPSFTVVSLRFDSGQSKVFVNWSCSSGGGQPLATDAEFLGAIDTAQFTQSTEVILGSVSFQYQPRFTQKFFHGFTMARSASRWPRNSGGVADPTCT